MENLQHNLLNPVAAIVEQEMTVAQFTQAVKHAAIQIQSGVNAVWGLGQKAVKMAYGGSEYAHDYVLALLNELPADAARQTHDWLKKAGITVNRPMTGSKLYWLSAVEKEVDGKKVQFITSKKPGEDGFGLAKEKAIHYVKTTPPMALERKEGKPKAVKVLEGTAKNRAREAIVGAMKRLQKTDLAAAREINDLITTVDDQQSCLFTEAGERLKLEKVELRCATEAVQAINEGRIKAEDLLKVLSGDYKIDLEPI